MKRKSPRYMGMTGMQLGILAGLSVVAMCSVGGLFWVILSMSLPPDTPAVPAPNATQISATASPTNTVTAELTPTITPTAVIIGTEVPPAGWIEFKTQGAGIWLPDNFVGGDLLTKGSETINKIKSQVSISKASLEMMQNGSSGIVLTAVDKNSTSLALTSVMVYHQKTDGIITLDDFVKAELSESEIAMSVVVFGKKKLTLIGHEAIRLELEYRASSRAFSKILYYIKDGADVWAVNYSFDPARILDMLPIVDQSIHTFNLVK